MKNEIWKNCSCRTHPRTILHLIDYMQTIGERKGSYPDKHYCGNYLTTIRQTKTQIIITVGD